MSRTEQLIKIRAKCVELLAIAEKRTPQRWAVKHYEGGLQSSVNVDINAGKVLAMCEWNAEADATFIASCAGPAEAGWRATIAGIDYLLNFATDDLPEHEMAQEIIAAWKGLV